jgi:hypothetical protein
VPLKNKYLTEVVMLIKKYLKKQFKTTLLIAISIQHIIYDSSLETSVVFGLRLEKAFMRPTGSQLLSPGLQLSGVSPEEIREILFERAPQGRRGARLRCLSCIGWQPLGMFTAEVRTPSLHYVCQPRCQNHSRSVAICRRPTAQQQIWYFERAPLWRWCDSQKSRSDALTAKKSRSEERPLWVIAEIAVHTRCTRGNFG